MLPSAWGTRYTPSWDGRVNVLAFLNDHAVWLEGRQNSVSKVVFPVRTFGQPSATMSECLILTTATW